MKAKRYFLDQDNSGHLYLVDASKRVEWDAWLGLDEDLVESWEAPAFAKRWPQHLSRLEFTSPKVLG